MLREQIKEQLVAAMKAKDEVKVSTLRMIGATLKDKAQAMAMLQDLDDMMREPE